MKVEYKLKFELCYCDKLAQISIFVGPNKFLVILYGAFFLVCVSVCVCACLSGL